MYAHVVLKRGMGTKYLITIPPARPRARKPHTDRTEHSPQQCPASLQCSASGRSAGLALRTSSSPGTADTTHPARKLLACVFIRTGDTSGRATTKGQCDRGGHATLSYAPMAISSSRYDTGFFLPNQSSELRHFFSTRMASSRTASPPAPPVTLPAMASFTAATWSHTSAGPALHGVTERGHHDLVVQPRDNSEYMTGGCVHYLGTHGLASQVHTIVTGGVRAQP